MALINRIGRNKRRLITVVLALCIPALTALMLFIFNTFYDDIYDNPCAVAGELDCGPLDEELKSSYYDISLYGEWELYYNQWIVTDNIDKPELTGYIDINKRWAGKTIGDVKLGNTGWATYRCVLKNVSKGTRIGMSRSAHNGAFIMYADRQIVCVYGEMSKDSGIPYTSGWESHRSWIVAEGGDVELLIEISNSPFGGFADTPLVCYRDGYYNMALTLQVLSFGPIAFGITVSLFCISILVNVCAIRRDRDFSISFLIGGLVLMMCFSADFMPNFCQFISGNYNLGQYLFYATCMLEGVVMMRWLRRNGMLDIGRLPLAVFGAINLGAAVAYYCLSGCGAAIYIALAQWAAYAVFIVVGIIAGKSEIKCSAAEYAAMCCVPMLILASALIGLTGVTGMAKYGTEIVFGTGMIMVSAIIFLVFWFRVRRLSGEAVEARIYKSETEAMRTSALINQIRSHFIFNQLSVIQGKYRDDIDEGERQMGRFARYLRRYVNSDSLQNIPFDEELENCSDYAALITHDKPFDLQMEIDCSDFSMPSLSLQPFIENSFKHGKVNIRKDGYIRITSKRAMNIVTVTVEDNGIGFDSENINLGDGIRNAVLRLKDGLNAQVNIISKPEKGCCVTITFEYSGGETSARKMQKMDKT
ncbi:MAG: histidine kinase [Clostridia bacterium]|nr:histidine kinase [Clostridia bacterium]